MNIKDCKKKDFSSILREYKEAQDAFHNRSFVVDAEKVKTIEDLIRQYDENESLGSVLLKLKGNKKFRCPHCHGNGYITEEYNAYPPNLPDSGFAYEAGYRDIKCEVCDGQGWTEKELRPKYKQVFDGYEEIK